MTLASVSHSMRSTLIFGATVMALTACASGPGGGDGQRGFKPGGFEGVGVHPMGILMIEMDSDRDGQTTRAELAAGRDALWNSPEFSDAPGPIKFGMWARRVFGSSDIRPGFLSYDRDFDSVISEDEFKETLGREFERLDKNTDGIVERSELVFTVDARSAERRGDRETDTGPGQRGGQGGGQGGRDRGGRLQR